MGKYGHIRFGDGQINPPATTSTGIPSQTPSPSADVAGVVEAHRILVALSWISTRYFGVSRGVLRLDQAESKTMNNIKNFFSSNYALSKLQVVM